MKTSGSALDIENIPKIENVDIYMYRGNGYLSYQKAIDKKNKDSDKRFENVNISKIKIPSKDIEDAYAPKMD